VQVVCPRQIVADQRFTMKRLRTGSVLIVLTLAALAATGANVGKTRANGLIALWRPTPR
jgi:hypothetical protein